MLTRNEPAISHVTPLLCTEHESYSAHPPPHPPPPTHTHNTDRHKQLEIAGTPIAQHQLPSLLSKTVSVKQVNLCKGVSNRMS
jgi:hypothetical protein